jgi:hypothetical protein
MIRNIPPVARPYDPVPYNLKRRSGSQVAETLLKFDPRIADSFKSGDSGRVGSGMIIKMLFLQGVYDVRSR